MKFYKIKKLKKLDRYFEFVNSKLDYLNYNQLEIVVDNQCLSIDLLFDILNELKKFNKNLKEFLNDDFRN